ncbi:hypothetical protein DY000_02001173 [Brassica cretica]|uniref:Uncharacterized protein n=1 Tax=Brassica cretica TaxID=69181 RepID=A0ABQ7C3L0_BRACR|nr:hypothetical protein DY000_02001173 [Brassica cretica]
MVTRVILIFFFSPSTSVLYLRPSFCQSNKRLTLHGRSKENSFERAKETKEDKQKTCQECRRLPQIRCILVRSSVFQIFTAPAADTDASAVIEGGGGGKKNKKRLSEKVKEYLNSDCHMYRPMISFPKPGSALKGTLQITNLVTMEVSARSATVREDNNYRNIRSDIAGHAMHNGRISVPKPALVILEGQRI